MRDYFKGFLHSSSCLLTKDEWILNFVMIPKPSLPKGFFHHSYINDASGNTDDSNYSSKDTKLNEWYKVEWMQHLIDDQVNFNF